MENNTFYHEILIDHNQHPVHKHKLEDANLVLEGVNPSCGDDIILQLKVEDGTLLPFLVLLTNPNQTSIDWLST